MYTSISHTFILFGQAQVYLLTHLSIYDFSFLICLCWPWTVFLIITRLTLQTFNHPKISDILRVSLKNLDLFLFLNIFPFSTLLSLMGHPLNTVIRKCGKVLDLFTQ